jgi:hypothetical protein
VNALPALCRKGSGPWPAELARLRERPRDWQPEDCIVVLLGFGITLDLDVPETRRDGHALRVRRGVA